MPEATYREVRRRIASITDPRWAAFFSTLYITAARISEIVGPYGLQKADVQEMSHGNEPILCFRLRTAKRGRQVRVVAVPLRGTYEPLAVRAWEYISQAPNGPIWSFRRQHAWRVASQLFQGLTYTIEPYYFRGERRDRHQKPLTLHGLRHLRASELVEYFGFDMIDAATFCGWDVGKFGPAVAERYVYLNWSRYIDKLFKPAPV